MARPGPIRDRGIVLRAIALGDTSRIVGVLTAEYGRVKLVAKGARKLGSRLGPLLEPGNELDLVFYPHADRDLWMLKEASLRRAALTGGGSLPKLSHLLATLELADRLLPEREKVREFEELVEGYLAAWHAGTDPEMAGLFFGFELRWLEAAGLGFDFEHCAECGRDPADGVRCQYRVAEGVVVCADCARSGGRWIDGGVLDALRSVDRLSPRGDFAGVPILEPGARRDVGRLLHEHMTFHLSHYRLPTSLYWAAPGRDGKSERA